MLYRIGVFAAMNHVTVKALRYYEEQGLLMPAMIHPETGYRYYTLSQSTVLHQITALKQAGLTLEEIARINSGANEEAVARFLRDEIGFYDIYRLVSGAVERVPFVKEPDLEQVLAADHAARLAVQQL